MGKPNISVVVPIYKVEKYLSRCVDSILDQTFRNLEVILVDDGSPDRCGEICDNYAKNDRRVKVIHKSNGGLSSARNAGIEEASGEYIAFIDSDDWIDIDMFELLYKAAQEYKAQIVECSFRHIYPHQVKEETSCTGACIEGTNLEALGACLDSIYFKSLACNKIYHRKVIQNIRYPVGRLHEDEFTTYKYLYNAQKLLYIDVSKYNYDRTREDSITLSDFREGHLDACFALRERIDFFREHEITSLEEKANNTYAWLLWDRLCKAKKVRLKGPKIDLLLEQAKRDIVYFAERPIDKLYYRQIQLLAGDGWRAKMKAKIWEYLV